ncbi:MAG: chemotaxis protein CheC, partial [Anaerotignaceae bacterium]
MSVRGLSSLEIDAIGEILNISIGASATAISTMLERRVDITIPSVQVSSYDDFEYPNMEPAICVEIGYASGLSGKNVMFLKREGVKAIVEILMHTEIPDEEFELDEMYLSAVCEVMNQMMGASATVLSDLLGKVVNIMTPVSHEIDTVIKFKDHYFVGGEDMVVVRFILNIEGVIESEFLNVMPVTLAREMLDCIGFRDESAEGSYEEAAKAPAEPAPSSGGVMSQEEIEKLL